MTLVLAAALILLALLVMVAAAEAYARLVLGLGDPPLWMADPEIEYLPVPSRSYFRRGKRIIFNKYSMRCREFPATREDPAAATGVGVSVHRQRLWAFTVSGALAGFAGGLLVHELGSITTEQVYLELTFITLAMLVIGGVSSLWGAVLGALAVSGLNSFLIEAEDGVGRIDLPAGSRLILLGAIMATMLILRPSGITGGREFTLPRLR